MPYSSKKQQAFAIAPLVILVIVYSSVLLFGLGEGSVYASPDLLFALNTAFLTVSGLIIAVLSAISYRSEGSLSLLLLGLATTAGGLSACVAGLAAIISVNFNVAIFNLGFLLSGTLQFLSAVLTITGAFPTSRDRRKYTLALGYFMTIFLVTAMSALVLSGLAPTFFDTTGPTVIRQWIIGAGTLLFSVSAAFFAWQYFQTKSKVLFWYTLALAFMALSLFSLAVYKTPNSVFNWTGRVAYFAAGFYFLIAVISTRFKKGLEEVGTTANWADAFRSDKQQMDTLFSKMLNGFAYHQIIVKEGKPVDYVYLALNDAFEKMTGIKRENVIGRRVTQILPGIDKDPADWIGIYGKVALTGQPTMFENYAAPLGKWFSVSAYSPKKGFFVAIFEDITERKKAELALKDSEEKFAKAFHSNSAAMTITRMIDGMILDANESFERLFGYSHDEVVGRTTNDLGIWLSQKERDAEVKRLIADGKLEPHEVIFGAKSGARINAIFSVELITFGGQRCILSTIMDITEREKAERELRASEERFRIALKNAPVSVAAQDLQLRYIWAYNQKTAIPNEIIGKTDSEIFTAQEAAHVEQIKQRVINEEVELREQMWLDRPSGKVYLDITWSPLCDENGKVIGVTSATVDLTAMKHAQIELEEKREQLEQTQKKLEENACLLEEYSNQMEELAKQRLEKLKESERLATVGATAGMVGHDIRNPLQAITGDLYLAKSEVTGLPESERKNAILESLEETEKNVEYINKIVQDLQDYARPLNPKAEESDLKEIVEKLIAKNDLPSNIKVTIKVNDEARKIRADSYYLNRILYNLVNNAIQAMPQGGKLIIKAEKGRNDTALTIKDTGIGIPKEMQSKLFTVMFTTKSKGQGFGLPVVKRMTESLGGTVTFESQEGKGTTFTIRLPQTK